MAESGLDLRAVEQLTELGQLCEVLPRVIAHCRALRAALAPLGRLLAASPAWKNPAIIPDDEYVHVRLGDLRRAAEVLRGAQDQEG